MRAVKFRGKCNGQWWHVTASDESDMGEWEQFWAPVDRKTVGEWSGLTDLDGCDVYEGDIATYQLLFDGKTYTGVIEYRRGAFMLDPALRIAAAMFLRVIGNIHDHPELLIKSKKGA